MLSAVEPAPDAAPRKAKPFLKRGEGVNKRLNAYKLRDEAEELRKQRASTSSSNTRKQPANSDQFTEPDSNAGRQPVQQRRAWQQQSRHQPVVEQQERAGEDEVLLAPRHGPAAAAAMHSSTPAAAAASEQSSWSAGQNVEVSAGLAAASSGQLSPDAGRPASQSAACLLQRPHATSSSSAL